MTDWKPPLPRRETPQQAAVRLDREEREVAALRWELARSQENKVVGVPVRFMPTPAPLAFLRGWRSPREFLLGEEEGCDYNWWDSQPGERFRGPSLPHRLLRRVVHHLARRRTCAACGETGSEGFFLTKHPRGPLCRGCLLDIAQHECGKARGISRLMWGERDWFTRTTLEQIQQAVTALLDRDPRPVASLKRQK